MLRFLADESCDFTAIRALRTEGFDVLSVAEATAGADDESVMALALRDPAGARPALGASMLGVPIRQGGPGANEAVIFVRAGTHAELFDDRVFFCVAHSVGTL